MSGRIPDYEEISDSNRPPSDPGFDREDTLTGMKPHSLSSGQGSDQRAGMEAAHAEHVRDLEQNLGALGQLHDGRLRRLELQEIDRRFSEVERAREETDNSIRALREMIVHVDEIKEQKHRRELQEMLDKINDWGDAMKKRTPGPIWKAFVIGCIVVGLLGLGGLGHFVFRGAVALEHMQHNQDQRARSLERIEQQERNR